MGWRMVYTTCQVGVADQATCGWATGSEVIHGLLAHCHVMNARRFNFTIAILILTMVLAAIPARAEDVGDGVFVPNSPTSLRTGSVLPPMARSPLRKFLALGGSKVVLYNRGQKTRCIIPLPDRSEAKVLAFSPDGRLLLAGGMRGASQKRPAFVAICDVVAGTLRRFARLRHRVISFAFADDSKVQVLTAGGLLTLYLPAPEISPEVSPSALADLHK